MNLLLIESIPGDVLLLDLLTALSNSKIVNGRSSSKRSSLESFDAKTSGFSAVSPRKSAID
jgi:hypothetical protein